ncbi:MAG: hypothetical protein A4E65_02820 [Syntrophorhabdus sp. PtaU1.Bin153]|nr:MAG: hypothetical protein A4E65_02820 [Syntrophorhabdus sp. PtaU1.Bin153]
MIPLDNSTAFLPSIANTFQDFSPYNRISTSFTAGNSCPSRPSTGCRIKYSCHELILLRFPLINSDQGHQPFVHLVPFRTTVKLVSLKWANPSFSQWLKHVHFPYGMFHFALTVVSCHSVTGTRVVAPTAWVPDQHKLSEPPAPASGYPARERARQDLQTYAASQGCRPCTIESDLVHNLSVHQSKSIKTMGQGTGGWTFGKLRFLSL